MEMKDLLLLCVKEKASDLHLSPGEPIILRLDGDLQFVKDMIPLDALILKNLIYSMMSPEQQKEFEIKGELDFAIELKEVSRFRVNVFRQSKGVAAVFRIIPEKVPTLDELRLPVVFKKLLALSNGIILVTGPTGSGKSTTLAAMIDYINTNLACHIITIEDPIEFTHRNKKCLINQRQIGRDTHNFSTALRSALREDPDVILLGEMRDLETIRLALTAAETGHLVVATLHASSAPRAVTRIVDVFPEGEKNIIRNLLSESLQAIICQTLVKQSMGGRIPAFEIMLATSAIRNLIREDKISQMYSAIQMGANAGMCTLDQHLLTLVNQQKIDRMIARETALNKELFL